MAREIPEVVRAAAGLAATVLDEARKLPTTLPGLPVRVIGMAMQKAMWLQQQYTGLVARGDELFTGIRGDQEPGMATFDDDEDVAPVEPTPDTGGYRESAFDRAAADVPDLVDAEYLVEDEPADVAAVEEVLEELAVEEALEDVAATEEVLEELAAAEVLEDVLEELAVEELVDDEVAGLPADPSPADVVAAVEEITVQVGAADLPPAALPSADLTTAEPEPDVTGDADALENALLEADAEEAAVEESAEVAGGQPDLPDVVAEVAEPAPDVESLVDVLTPDGSGVETVEATVTDEGVATPVEASGTGTPAGPAVATDEGGTPVAAADAGGADTAGTPDETQDGGEAPGPETAGSSPIEGYDSWSVAQLRGRLRGYQSVTVQSLIAYEEGTRAREPYLRMLRNRLQKLDEQAVAASPLAPRGTGA
jgi:hypothetical protein